jgi:hypothetical protein
MPGGREPLGTWLLWSPPAPGGGSGAIGHVAISESCRVVVLVPRSRGNARAFLRRGQAWSREVRSDSGALLPGDMLGGSGHVATPEPFPSRWHAWCLGARGDTRALF